MYYYSQIAQAKEIIIIVAGIISLFAVGFSTILYVCDDPPYSIVKIIAGSVSPAVVIFIIYHLILAISSVRTGTLTVNGREYRVSEDTITYGHAGAILAFTSLDGYHGYAGNSYRLVWDDVHENEEEPAYDDLGWYEGEDASYVYETYVDAPYETPAATTTPTSTPTPTPLPITPIPLPSTFASS